MNSEQRLVNELQTFLAAHQSMLSAQMEYGKTMSELADRLEATGEVSTAIDEIKKVKVKLDTVIDRSARSRAALYHVEKLVMKVERSQPK